MRLYMLWSMDLLWKVSSVCIVVRHICVWTAMRMRFMCAVLVASSGGKLVAANPLAVF